MLSLLLTAALAASPSNDASKLFDEGRAALKANDLPRACEAFRQSHQLQPALGVLLNLATCLERQGKLASAWVRFNEAGAWAARTHESEREQLARAGAAKLKPRLSWLALSVAGECEITVDEASPLSLSPQSPTSVPLDPGTHRLQARATGFESWTSTLTILPDGAPALVSVPALKPIAPPPPPPLTPVAEVTPPPRVGPPPPLPPLVVASSGPSGAGVALIVAGGVMVVGGGVGLGWSLTTYGTLQGQKASLPNPDVQVSRATFDQLTWIFPTSVAVLSVGAVAAVTGVVLTVHGSSTKVTPVIAPGTAGVSLSGSF